MTVKTAGMHLHHHLLLHRVHALLRHDALLDDHEHAQRTAAAEAAS